MRRVANIGRMFRRTNGRAVTISAVIPDNPERSKKVLVCRGYNYGWGLPFYRVSSGVEITGCTVKSGLEALVGSTGLSLVDIGQYAGCISNRFVDNYVFEVNARGYIKDGLHRTHHWVPDSCLVYRLTDECREVVQGVLRSKGIGQYQDYIESGIQYYQVGAIIEVDGKVLLMRPEDKSIAGIYGLPGGEIYGDKTPIQLLMQYINRDLGVDVALIKSLVGYCDVKEDIGMVRHLVYSIRLTDNVSDRVDVDWCTRKGVMARYNIPNPLKKLLEIYFQDKEDKLLTAMDSSNVYVPQVNCDKDREIAEMLETASFCRRD